jgi:hypothetical protein
MWAVRWSCAVATNGKGDEVLSNAQALGAVELGFRLRGDGGGVTTELP